MARSICRRSGALALPLHQLESFVTTVRRELGLSTPAGPAAAESSAPIVGVDGGEESPHILVDGATTRCSICRVTFPDFIVQRAHCRYAMGCIAVAVHAAHSGAVSARDTCSLCLHCAARTGMSPT